MVLTKAYSVNEALMLGTAEQRHAAAASAVAVVSGVGWVRIEERFGSSCGGWEMAEMAGREDGLICNLML